MKAYLLDTNHLSEMFQAPSRVRVRIDHCRRTGLRVGTCMPVICELEAGFRGGTNGPNNRRFLDQLLKEVRIWPIERSTAQVYGRLFVHLRSTGRVLSQVDLMLAALALDLGVVLATSDRDFKAAPGLAIEDWLA